MLLQGTVFQPPGILRDRSAKTGTYTVVAGDNGVLIDGTSGTWTLDLTASATLGSGFKVGVYNSGSGTITIDPAGVETIRSPSGSAATLALTQGQGVFIECDGSGWLVVASTGLPWAPSTPVVVYDNAFTIKDETDPTKTLVFSLGAMTAGVDVILNAGAQTADRTISLPVVTGNDTLAAIGLAQTWTAAQSFTTGTTTISTADINGGAIDGTAIGASSASTGAFTTLSANSTTSISGAATFTNTLAHSYTGSGAGSTIGANFGTTFQNTGGTNRAATFVATANPSGASTANTTGFEARSDLSGSATITPSGTFRGLDASVRINSGAAAGTIGTAYGLQASISNQNASTTITTAAGLIIPTPTVTGTITTYYGLLIQNTAGSTSYAIYTNDGANSLGGSLTIRPTTGTTLTVSSTNAAAVSVSGGVTAASITDSGLTSGRITFATTGGLLTDSGDLLWTAASKYLTIGGGTGECRYRMNQAAGGTSGFEWQTGGLSRWLYYVTGAETGSDAGCNLVLGRAYDDTGTGIDNPITINRAAGGSIVIIRPISHSANFAQTGATTFGTGTGTFTHNGAITIADAINVTLNTTTGSMLASAANQKLGLWGATPVIQQVGGVTLTNNVTAGGTTNQLDDFTSLTVYATDAAAIRNNIYQLGRKLKLVTDALRTIGALQNADS